MFVKLSFVFFIVLPLFGFGIDADLALREYEQSRSYTQLMSESNVSDSKSVFQDEKNDYGKPTIYKYLVEPLIHLDQFLQNPHFKITHCSVVKESDLESVKTYAGLGACLLDQIQFSLEEKEKIKSIIAYAMINESVDFDLLITWEPFRWIDIFSSYWNEDLSGMSNQISIQGVSQENLLELAHSIVELFLGRPQDWNDLGFSSSNLNIKEIKFQLRPYQRDSLMSFTLILLNEKAQPIYKLETVTDYYINADDFFIMSKDKYESVKLNVKN